MEAVNEFTRNPAFGLTLNERESNMKARKKIGHIPGYKRTRLKNPVSQEREEVELFDINDEHNEDRLAVESYPELHADLTKAFAPFTHAQKLILSRVLLQGQSVEEASKYSRKSRSYWTKWLAEKALPYLRERLSDYIENGKLVLR